MSELPNFALQAQGSLGFDSRSREPDETQEKRYLSSPRRSQPVVSRFVLDTSVAMRIRPESFAGSRAANANALSLALINFA